MRKMWCLIFLVVIPFAVAVERRRRGADDEEINGIVSVDPGRVAIIHAMKFDKAGNLIEIIRLTRKQYYAETGIKEAVKQANEWNLRIKSILEEQSRSTLKTADIDEFRNGLNVIGNNYEALWAHNMLKCFKNQAFALHGAKRSRLRRTINSFRRKDSSFLVGYGDGSFPSTAKGETSVPVKEVKDMCARVHMTMEVPEWRTSSVCPDCGAQLFTVYHAIDGDRVERRGMKWCNSQICRHAPIKHRENVGGYDIYLVMKAGLFDTPLPNFLDRQSQTKDVGWVNPKLPDNKVRLVAGTTSAAPRPPNYIVEKRRQRKKEKRVRARARANA